jgi:AcrR family transcriptional regulator
MGADTRKSVIEAAEALIGRYGYKKTTVDDIAQSAGIAKGTVYLYFKSKEEIALAVVDKVNTAIQSRIREIARAKLTPEEKLRRMLVARVMIRFDGIQNYVDSVEDFMLRGRQAFMAWRDMMNRAEAEIFCEVLIEGRMQSRFRVEDAMATAEALLSATSSLMPFDLATSALARRDQVESMARRIADLLLYGMVLPAT